MGEAEGVIQADASDTAGMSAAALASALASAQACIKVHIQHRFQFSFLFAVVMSMITFSLLVIEHPLNTDQDKKFCLVHEVPPR